MPSRRAEGFRLLFFSSFPLGDPVINGYHHSHEVPSLQEMNKKSEKVKINIFSNYGILLTTLKAVRSPFGLGILDQVPEKP